jgi:23S rRNA (guanosine2251-2'-O)-methyltransferase
VRKDEQVMSDRKRTRPPGTPESSRRTHGGIRPGEGPAGSAATGGARTGGRRKDSERQRGLPPARADAAERDRDAEEAALSGEYLAGKHPVLEALKAGRALNKIWLSNQAQRSLVQPIADEAKARGVVVQFVDKRKLDSLVPGVLHQGVVAQAAAVSYFDVEDLLARASERGEAPLLVLLDEVEDPHNLGSILRTADCTGAHGVIVPKRRSAGLTAVVAKTSAGAVEYVPVARVANLAQTIERLKEAGVWIAGADAAASQDVYGADLKGPLAIVIGSEGRGLSRLVREKCDFLLSLPMFGRINSLNASVAAGVILYEAVRQRRGQARALEGGHASP